MNFPIHSTSKEKIIFRRRIFSLLFVLNRLGLEDKLHTSGMNIYKMSYTLDRVWIEHMTRELSNDKPE